MKNVIGHETNGCFTFLWCLPEPAIGFTGSCPPLCYPDQTPVKPTVGLDKATIGLGKITIGHCVGVLCVPTKVVDQVGPEGAWHQ